VGTEVILDWPDNYANLCVYPRSPSYASFIHPLSWFMQGKLGSCALPDAAEADGSNLENLVDPQMSNRISLYSSLDLGSGNVYQGRQAGPLGFSYNSLDANDGPLGVGWTHDFNLSLTVNSDGSLCLRGFDGSIAYFDKGTDNIYRGDPRSRDSSTIVKNADGTFTRTTKYRKTYKFDASGKLVRVADRNGNAVTLTYTGSDLTRIKDAVGRTAKIGVIGGKIVSVTDYYQCEWGRTKPSG
jgi:YD repeat-containing protein